MRKIILSQKAKENHKKYFKDNIVVNFTSVTLIQEEIDLYMKFHKLDISKDFPNEHDKFMEYCDNNYETLSIGLPSELSEIQDYIKENYKIIFNMIKIDKELRNKIKGKKLYKDKLLDIFGYENFKVKDFFYYVNKEAQHMTEHKSYCNEVQSKIADILVQRYPQQKLDIESSLLPKDINGNIKYINVNSIKKIIYKTLNLHITMKNFEDFKIFAEEWNDYSFVMESGIRVCPYCNRQYITPVFTNNGMVRADIDHFLPKSIYPYFSMSLHNLIPVCKPCNQSLKRDTEFTFDNIHPYEDNIDDYFTFETDFLTNQITTNKAKNTDQIKEHLDTFKIEELYNYHQNQAKELIEKRIAYPDYYIDKLYKEYKDYFIDKEYIKQLIIGYVLDKNMLNNEAFLKFRYDICKQLGFIDSTENQNLINVLKSILKNDSKKIF